VIQLLGVTNPSCGRNDTTNEILRSRFCNDLVMLTKYIEEKRGVVVPTNFAKSGTPLANA